MDIYEFIGSASYYVLLYTRILAAEVVSRNRGNGNQARSPPQKLRWHVSNVPSTNVGPGTIGRA